MFGLINGGERLPQRATKHSAGFDVFANENIVIGAGETALVGLGICLDVDSEAAIWFLGVSEEYSYDQFMKTHYFELHPRSSLRAKGLAGGVGIIDIDYRDEIKVVITNPYDRQEQYTIKRGDPIGQLILCRHEGYLLPSEYTKDDTRNGGFGSTY